jgi:hypothetical protein
MMGSHLLSFQAQDKSWFAVDVYSILSVEEDVANDITIITMRDGSVFKTDTSFNDVTALTHSAANADFDELNRKQT